MMMMMMMMMMMRCGSTYTPDQLGNGDKFDAPKFVTARAKCLHQVWLRCPTLPLALETNWEVHKLAFAKRCCVFWKKTPAHLSGTPM